MEKQSELAKFFAVAWRLRDQPQIDIGQLAIQCGLARPSRPEPALTEAGSAALKEAALPAA